MGKKKRAETKKDISPKRQSEVVMPFEEPIKKHLILIFILLAITAGVYSNSLFNGFVYDDESTIVNNTLIKNFSNLSKLFTKEYFTASAEMSYRPVVTFTYFLDYALYGINPWGYHLTNLLLHAINGVLLYIFLFQLSAFSPQPSATFKPLYFSLFSSLIFVTHPVLTEAVNAISFREDLLAFLFFISALILYIRGKSYLASNFLPLASCILYLLALLSKEMAITFPLIIFLYEWFSSDKSPLSKGVRGLSSILFNPYTIGYIAVTIFYLYLRFFLFHNPAEDIYSWSLSERLMTVPYLIIKYLILLIAPVSLSADYVITPVQALVSLKFIIPFIVIIFIIMLPLIFSFQSSIFNRQSVFGILFLLITLLPVYNAIPISNPFAERYLYLPSVGFAIILGVGIHRIFTIKTSSPIRGEGWGEGWFLKKQNLYILIISVLLLSIYSFTVIKRNKIWLDNYSLWSDTVIKMPESS